MDFEVRNKLLDLVHSRPRSILEIANSIDKNWMTADKYVEELAAEDLLKVHVFRKGSRGALKVAYWPSSLNESPSAAKNFMLQKILNTGKKEDFSPLDILQYVKKDNRKIEHMTEQVYHSDLNVNDMLSRFGQAKKRILFFSGNLSFFDIGGKGREVFDLIESKIKSGVEVFVLTRADVSNNQLIEDLLQINKKGHSGKIEIRYAQQPLRCSVIDDNIFYIKESFSQFAQDSSSGLLRGEYVYIITDSEWVDWLTKVFWHIWAGAINATERLKVLNDIIEKK